MLTNEERKRCLRNLCYYDPRNPDADPDCIEENIYPKENCNCDNCFKGCTWLAMRLLKLEENFRKEAWVQAQG